MSDNTSFNKIVLEAYKKEELKHNIHSGWSSGPDQRSKLKGLKVLMDARLPENNFVSKGSIAYIREETLFNGTVGKNVYKSDTLPCEFIVVNPGDVEFFTPPAGDAA